MNCIIVFTFWLLTSSGCHTLVKQNINLEERNLLADDSNSHDRTATPEDVDAIFKKAYKSFKRLKFAATTERKIMHIIEVTDRAVVATAHIATNHVGLIKADPAIANAIPIGIARHAAARAIDIAVRAARAAKIAIASSMSYPFANKDAIYIANAARSAAKYAAYAAIDAFYNASIFYDRAYAWANLAKLATAIARSAACAAEAARDASEAYLAAALTFGHHFIPSKTRRDIAIAADITVANDRTFDRVPGHYNPEHDQQFDVTATYNRRTTIYDNVNKIKSRRIILSVKYLGDNTYRHQILNTIFLVADKVSRGLDRDNFSAISITAASVLHLATTLLGINHSNNDTFRAHLASANAISHLNDAVSRVNSFITYLDALHDK